MLFTNVVISEEMVDDTCVLSPTAIDNTFEQLETNVSQIIYCLRLFVVYKHVKLHGQMYCNKLKLFATSCSHVKLLLSTFLNLALIFSNIPFNPQYAISFKMKKVNYTICR